MHKIINHLDMPSVTVYTSLRARGFSRLIIRVAAGFLPFLPAWNTKNNTSERPSRVCSTQSTLPLASPFYFSWLCQVLGSSCVLLPTSKSWIHWSIIFWSTTCCVIPSNKKMVDTEVKNRKVNRSKNAKSEKASKSKEVINPAVDPRDEVSSETENVCISSLS